MSSFYSDSELTAFGFKYVGKNVLLSRKASVYGAGNISLGDHCRVDDFSILSGHITVGKHVHIAAFCGIFAGAEGVDFGDFSGLSSGVSIYAVSDDYSGAHLTNPTIPDKYRAVVGKKVEIKKHAIVGAKTVILPGAIIEEGVAVGAQSLVTKPTEPWSIYAGIPARLLKKRDDALLVKEAQFKAEVHNV